MHTAVLAEGLADDVLVERAVGEMFSALDDRVLDGWVYPNICALFIRQLLTPASENVCDSTKGQTHSDAHTAVALNDSLLIHRNISVLKGLVDFHSEGYRAAVT